jgi:chitodextrinase
MSKRLKSSFLLLIALLLAVGVAPYTALAVADPITPGTLTLTPTYSSISVDLPITGDDNVNATATLQFKRTGDTEWRNGLDLWRWDNGTSRGFTGSVLLADSNTSYDVKVTITDPDGGGTTRIGTVTTREDNISDASTLIPTHYVNVATGNDANNGLSAATSWKTLEKAVQAANAAAADMVIRVAPGYYAAPMSELLGNGKKIAFVAENLAVDGNGNITATSHSVLYDRYVAPTGSADTVSLGTGGWTAANLQGAGHSQNYPSGVVPNPIPNYTVWTRDVGSNNIASLSYAPVSGSDYTGAKSSQPLRVGKWKRDQTTGTTIGTAAGFAETVHTNYSYKAGYWQDGTTNTVYLVLPNGINPNNCYIWLGDQDRAAFSLNGLNLRVSGFSIRSFNHGITLKTAADNAVIDHNLTRNNFHSVNGENRLAGDPNRSEYVTIQYNRFTDSNLWSTTERVIPWVWIKGRFITGDETAYDGGTRIGEKSETNGISVKENGAHWIIRSNVFDGHFNGVVGNLANTDRFNYYGFDIHDNSFINLADDALEPEGAAQNWRFWNNTIRDVFSGISTDSRYGPYYVFRNTMWMTGAHGLTDNGHPTTPEKPGTGNFVKYGTNKTPTALWYFVHNTFWTNSTKTNGWADNIGTDRKESWWLRNNLVRVPHYSLRIGGLKISGWNEDYNFFASEVVPDATFGGFKYMNVTYNSGAVIGTGSIADYRTVSGQGAHTNRVGGADYNFVNSGDNLSGLAKLDQMLVSPVTGNLTLVSGSVAVNAGVPVPNISDRAGTDYSGSAPDLGAFEAAGGDTQTPSAPTNLNSPSKTETTVALTWTASTDNVGVTGYDMFKDGTKVNASDITGTSYTVTSLYPSTTYTFTVKAKDAAGNVSAASNALSVTTSNSGDPNLKGHWKFDETSGTTAADSSGNNKAGTVMNGAAWVASGKINGAMDFDGTDDYVSLPNIIDPSTIPVTASAWIKPDVSDGIRSVLVQEGTNGKKWLYREGGLLTSYLLGSKVQSTGTIATGAWNHVAITYDGTILRLYLNGQPDGSSSVGKPEPELSGMRVGIDKSGSTKFDGMIDDVRIYNRALSGSEILNLYNSGN